jgi:putative ABC transport system permease protein
MFKNLVKIALRIILKDFGYSLLNIAGLTIGIASALFLIIYIGDEMSYDRHHEHADRIYRVSSTITEPDDQFTWIIAQIPFGPQVKSDYPEIEAYTRFIDFGRTLFTYEEKEFFEDRFYYADTSYFEVFTTRILAGSAEKALSEPNVIVLTKTIADKYFGTEDPIGKTLTAGERTFRVTAVMEDVPFNSHFRYDALVSRSSLPDQIGSWGNFGVYTYLLLPEGYDATILEDKMTEMYDKYMAGIFERMGITIKYHLEPMTRIHLYSSNSQEPEPTGSISYVYIFGVVALFLILIAAMNYMNLATARSVRRAREVGLRKVVGAGSGRLILQFLTESVILTLVAAILSILLIVLLLPQFNQIAGKNFGLDILFSPPLVMGLISVIVFVGIVGGSYPAFYLSRFNPVRVLKGETGRGSSGSIFRKVLVVIQFSISVIMIISTLTVFRQLDFLRNKDLGYDMENVVSLNLSGRAMIQKFPVLKQTLLANPEILSVSSTNTPIGEGSGKVIFRMETPDGMIERGVNFAVVDHNFIPTLGINILEGRPFREDMPSDTLMSVIVNETLARRMNWDEPIGKQVDLGDGSFLSARVIGVMKDYHQTGMYNEIESLMLIYRLINPVVYIKVSETGVQAALKHMESSWHELFPAEPFEYSFLTDTFRDQFAADQKRGMIFSIFTILAIIIACLGLFGLAAYTVEQRTKEIGVRKVMGASELSIIRLISLDFLMLIAISILIAFPVAWYFMNDWLKNFIYRTDLSVLLFVMSAGIALVVTFLTVNYQAWKAAVANPAQSLRVE